jgi:hypothetical protein
MIIIPIINAENDEIIVRLSAFVGLLSVKFQDQAATATRTASNQQILVSVPPIVIVSSECRVLESLVILLFCNAGLEDESILNLLLNLPKL